VAATVKLSTSLTPLKRLLKKADLGSGARAAALFGLAREFLLRAKIPCALPAQAKTPCFSAR
jgi:hypothetical protein